MEEQRMKVERFEDLQAWVKARELVNRVYRLCKDSGLAKDFGLRDQLQRAAVSVMSTLQKVLRERALPRRITSTTLPELRVAK